MFIWRTIQIMAAKISYEYKLSYVKMQVLAALLIFQETWYKTQGMKFYAKSLKRGNLIFAQRKIHFYDSVSTREQNKILVTMNNLCLSIFAWKIVRNVLCTTKHKRPMICLSVYMWGRFAYACLFEYAPYENQSFEKFLRQLLLNI